MTDGGTYSSLRQRYASTLTSGEASLRALLGAPSSAWRPLQTTNVAQRHDDDVSRASEGSSSNSCVSSRIEGPIIVHRKKARNAPDVIRAICHVRVEDHASVLESFRAILQTSEIRPVWDPVTEKQESLEIVEPGVKVLRSYTRIGWPSNPRDVVMVNKVLQDPGKTLIDLSISLPRSSASKNSDPPFLQPSPPYVRSHLHLCAFVVTFPKNGIARVSMYWQWDLRASGLVWGSHITSMPEILRNLVKQASEKAGGLPYLRGWGREVALDSSHYETNQDRLEIEYGIYQEQGAEDGDKHQVQLEKSKERRRLERALELRLPPLENAAAGWDISVTISPAVPGDQTESTWRCVAERPARYNASLSRVTLRFTHVKSVHEYVSVRVAVQRVAGSKLLRLNGKPLSVTIMEERDPAAFVARSLASPESLKLDVASIATATTADSSSAASVVPASPATEAKSSAAKAAQAAMVLHNKRAYTGFLALLQSPLAKWKPVTDIRRVSVSSYSSIDTTAVPVYKFEATFVNTSIWDIFSVFVNSNARLAWNKASGLDEFRLLREVQTSSGMQSALNLTEAGSTTAGEGITSFYLARWKAAWPAVPREALLLRTIYKSPTSIHVFFTSVPENDSDVYGHIADLVPKSDANTIRMYTHLQAVAIDQISPTTTTLTLVDQTDPKGWSKSGYSATAAAVGSIGEYALKSGAPPVVTQLTNAIVSAQANPADQHETFRLSYEPVRPDVVDRLECVLRCDNTIWSSGGISISVEPAPSRISVLIRHRLSDRGSGCWVTLEHESQALPSDDVSNQVVIRIKKGDPDGGLSFKERNTVWVNGEKVKVDVEALKDEEVKELKAKKRVRNTALLLDQPPTNPKSSHKSRPSSTFGVEDFPPVSTPPVDPRAFSFAPQPAPQETQLPMQYALAALTWVQAFYTEQAHQDTIQSTDDWVILSYAENNSPVRISKRLLPQLSSTLPLYRVERTFPRTEASQVMRLASSNNTALRASWDDRISTIEPISHYENGCSTSVWVTRPAFPMRGRIAYTANIRAQMVVPAPPESKNATSTVYLYASASLPMSAFELEQTEAGQGVDVQKLNPSKMSEGKILLEGWIIEEGTEGDSSQDDEEGPEERDDFTRCSFFTCSDLPGVGSGPFGMASIRARLSSLFDSMEAALKRPVLMTALHAPVFALQIEGSLQRHDAQNECWQVKLAKSHSQVVSSSGSSTVLLISAPPPAPVARKGDEQLGETADKRIPGAFEASSSKAPLSRSISVAPVIDPPSRPAGPKHATSSLSLTRLRAASLTTTGDTIIAEIVVQRDSTLAGYDIRTSATLLDTDGTAIPSDPSYWRPFAPLPVKVAVVALSTPVALATTYLLRLSLPTSQFTSPIQHPLSSLTTTPTLPKWYRKLTEGRAFLQIQVVPVKVELQVEGRPASPLKVTLNGNSVNLSGEADVKALLQRIEDDEHRPEASKLSRVACKASDALLPQSLAKPKIVNSAFLVGALANVEDAGLQSPTDPSPRFENLQRRVASDATITSAVTNLEKATLPLVEMFTATTLIAQGSAVAGGKPLTERTYRLSFVLLVAAMSFLIGSLLRSLLSPGDYVFFTRSLDNVEGAMLELLDPKRKWMYATRLFELPIPGLGRDLIAAVVERH